MCYGHTVLLVYVTPIIKTTFIMLLKIQKYYNAEYKRPHHISIKLIISDVFHGDHQTNDT